MPRYKIMEFQNTVPSIERVIEGGPEETLKEYALLIREHATTSTRANTLIETASNALPTLQLGMKITGIPNDVTFITIHRLTDHLTHSK
jgi:hypothetical protein